VRPRRDAGVSSSELFPPRWWKFSKPRPSSPSWTTGIGWAPFPEPVQSLALEDVACRSLANVDPHTDLELSTCSEASPTVLHAADLMADATMASSPMSPVVDG